ncbi:MAG: GNAT family N-acetyltransferase [Actinobacteria bacterium]|nr:GNAT family N-acetyltransferase [Actinomycetota bacterium]
MPIPESLVHFWRALDDLLGEVEPTPWGAVVTDPRFPSIWDANYARIDQPAEGLTFAEVEGALSPALERAGARTFHVVSFFPEETRDLLAELSSRGDALSWDVALRLEDGARSEPGDHRIEEVPAGDELWDAVRGSLELFGIDDPGAVEQLMRLERDVLSPAGKRWFAIRDRGRLVSVAALLLLEGIAYVDDVATFPASRGRGFASALTLHLGREARAAGAQDVYLSAEPDGPVGMYERLGFREAGRLASTRGPFPR